MSMLDPATLAALSEALARATPLPWCYDGGEMLMLPSPSKMHDPNGREGWCGEAAGDNDGILMVMLANAAPSLLAAARDAERLRGALEEALPIFESAEEKLGGASIIVGMVEGNELPAERLLQCQARCDAVLAKLRSVLRSEAEA